MECIRLCLVPSRLEEKYEKKNREHIKRIYYSHNNGYLYLYECIILINTNYIYVLFIEITLDYH